MKEIMYYSNLTDEQADLLLEYYIYFMALLAQEDDIHVFASGIVFLDEITTILDTYMGGK